MRSTSWVFLLFPVFLSSCLFGDDEPQEVIEYTKADLRASVTNPEVPSRLWEMVEDQYSKGLKIDEYSEKLDREKYHVTQGGIVVVNRQMMGQGLSYNPELYPNYQ